MKNKSTFKNIAAVTLLLLAHLGQAQTITYPQGGYLPRPVAPPLPPLPSFTEFSTGDEQRDLALNHLLTEMPTLPQHRSRTAGAEWYTMPPSSVLAPMPTTRCFQSLTSLGIDFLDVESALTSAVIDRGHKGYLRRQLPHILEHVPSPVILPSGIVNGVKFTDVNGGRPLVFACDLVLRLYEMARIWASYNVAEIGVLSSHRDHPEESFHTRGYAIDISWIKVNTNNGRRTLSLTRDFYRTARARTCNGEAMSTIQSELNRNPRKKNNAELLLNLTCSLFNDFYHSLFNTIITPNYNDGHRDHFHFDVRPYDNRLFVR